MVILDVIYNKKYSQSTNKNIFSNIKHKKGYYMSENITSKQHFHWIDIAKGFCIIAVILGHFHKPEWDFLYSFHLTVFFILSGYTMKVTPVTTSFLKAKFNRLMTPFFLTCFAVTGMDVINAVFKAKTPSIIAVTEVLYKNIIKLFFASGGSGSMGTINFGKAIGAIWFLPALFFAITITQILLNFIKSNWKIATISISIAILSAAIGKLLWLPFSFLSGAFAIPFIFLGKLLKDYNIIENFIKWWHLLILGAIFAIGCLLGYGGQTYMVSCYMKDWLISPLLSICSSMVVIGGAKLIKRFSFLEFIGKNSLTFLCVHLFEMNTFYPYYNDLKKLFPILESNYYLMFLVRLAVIFALVGSIMFFKLLSKKLNSNAVSTESDKTTNRDLSIDIMRSLLIILMIIGYFTIFRGFRNIIYSFHMMAFVMISGYFYKAGIPWRSHLKKTLKALLPYIYFSIVYIILYANNYGFAKISITLIGGSSYTKNIFTNLASVGPVYFILLLFLTKVLYIFIDIIKNEWLKNAVVLGVLFISVIFGNLGIWLPWSFDCAMFSVVFYHIAHYLKKFRILEKCKNSPYIYFILSPIWAFMIYSGPMEISVRRYGNIGLTIAGVVSAFVVVYLLCSYLNNILPNKLSNIFSLIGQSTAQLLVIHTLFGSKITNFLDAQLGLNKQNIFCLVGSIIIQITIAILIFILNRSIKQFIKSSKSKNLQKQIS